MLVPSTASAEEDARVAKSMETLKALTAKLGVPKVQGNDPVVGKGAPSLYFGTTKVNNDFDIVDAVGKEDGKGMTATLFVKNRVYTTDAPLGRLFKDAPGVSDATVQRLRNALLGMIEDRL